MKNRPRLKKEVVGIGSARVRRFWGNLVRLRATI